VFIGFFGEAEKTDKPPLSERSVVRRDGKVQAKRILTRILKVLKSEAKASLFNVSTSYCGGATLEPGYQRVVRSSRFALAWSTK
jgi:hypothetical protein